MIYKLQRKFILIGTVAVIAVEAIMFLLLMLLNISSMNKTLDTLADRVLRGGGAFPDMHIQPPPIGEESSTRSEEEVDFITPETPYSTRHFTVWLDTEGTVIRTKTENIYSVSDESAVEYAKMAAELGCSSGWIGNYRYKIYENKDERTVVFIDGSMNRSVCIRTMSISLVVLLGIAVLVITLIVLLSRRAVKPVAQSYERQKQFVTDANHELKTPLTLILANLDLAEAELGENEWLSDIRSEGERMTELVNRLVMLSRLDERSEHAELSELSLSELLKDTASDFSALAETKGLSFGLDVADGIRCCADEAELRRLVCILLDNAVKYCDDGGEITVTLTGRHRSAVLCVENTYHAVNEIELGRLFDRFYRADKARTYTGGFGIGLSMAKSIAEAHHAEISAYKRDPDRIGFRVVLK